MNFQALKELDSKYVMSTYARFPVAIDRAKGATLYDLEGREYIDFTSGIGVNSVGYGHPKWVAAVAEQAGKLAHISNLYYTEPCVRLAEGLCRRSGMVNAFFSNSGAEANEGAIKLARKYSFDKYGKGRGTIITLQNSFHGRTITTLAATGQESFHNYFFPFTEGFRYAEAGDIASVKAVAGHDVCAVMVELVQGEGGVYPLSKEYVHALAVLCAERDWLLLVDEVQTGIGRTGTLFAFQQYGILPDVVSFAKGVAGGLPFGGILASERCRKVLSPGTHATTFGGNPIAAAAGLAVLDILDENTFAAVKEKGSYIREFIESLNSPYVAGIRGLGMMIGVVVQELPPRVLVELLMKKQLLCLTAGKDALRLLPPLTISDAELEKGLEIIRSVLA